MEEKKKKGFSLSQEIIDLLDKCVDLSKLEPWEVRNNSTIVSKAIYEYYNNNIKKLESIDINQN